jgi:hypothetical protein
MRNESQLKRTSMKVPGSQSRNEATSRSARPSKAMAPPPTPRSEGEPLPSELETAGVCAPVNTPAVSRIKPLATIKNATIEMIHCDSSMPPDVETAARWGWRVGLPAVNDRRRSPSPAAATSTRSQSVSTRHWRHQPNTTVPSGAIPTACGTARPSQRVQRIRVRPLPQPVYGQGFCKIIRFPTSPYLIMVSQVSLRQSDLTRLLSRPARDLVDGFPSGRRDRPEKPPHYDRSQIKLLELTVK